MKRTSQLLITSILSAVIHITALSQEKDYFGEYRPAVQKAIIYLQMIESQDIPALKQSFTESSFQDRDDFAYYISPENIAWSSALIKKYGIPGDDQTAISVWRIGDKKNEDASASVNLSFYFKDPSQPMSLLCDRISINMSVRGGEYLLDGVLLFRKSEYDTIEKIIQDIPE